MIRRYASRSLGRKQMALSKGVGGFPDIRESHGMKRGSLNRTWGLGERNAARSNLYLHRNKHLDPCLLPTLSIAARNSHWSDLLRSQMAGLPS